MIKKTLVTLVLASLMVLLLAACGGTAVSPPPTSPPPTAEPESAPAEAPAESSAAGSRTFVVVTDESQASYIVDEEFFADALEKLGIEAGKKVIVGTTPGVSGEIQLNLGASEPVEAAQFTVDMTGLKTDQDNRDEWLLENAIESGVFPEATFTATAATGLPDSINEGEEVNFQLTGDLTVRDLTRSVTFDVTAVLSGDTLQGTATLPLKMTDFGITPPDFANTLTVADDFTIEVQITAREG